MKAIYGILLLLITFSCAKDGGGFLGLGEGGETTVKGKVTEKGSGKAVSGAEVLLKSQSEGSSTAEFIVDTFVITDANGNYSFSFTADKERDYEVQPKHSLYKNTQSYKSISSGRKNETDLELEPWAWVRVHIINEPPLDTLGYVGFNSFHNTIPGLQGFASDTILIGKATGNVDYKITVFWKYIALSETEKKRVDYLYCSGLDTVDYYFKY